MLHSVACNVLQGTVMAMQIAPGAVGIVHSPERPAFEAIAYFPGSHPADAALQVADPCCPLLHPHLNRRHRSQPLLLAQSYSYVPEHPLPGISRSTTLHRVLSPNQDVRALLNANTLPYNRQCVNLSDLAADQLFPICQLCSQLRFEFLAQLTFCVPTNIQSVLIGMNR